MKSDLRLSHQGLRILRVFLDAMAEDLRAELAGTDIMSATGLPSGTLYPILLRFERARLLDSHWERGKPEKLGRPRRRYYRMTPAGERLAHSALSDLSPKSNKEALTGA